MAARCLAVLPNAVAISAEDEQHFDEGGAVFVRGLATEPVLIGYVTGIRQHGQRADWTALDMSRSPIDVMLHLANWKPYNGCPLRGAELSAETNR